jgi:phage-related protein (TIGR01555 family)
MSRKRKPRAKTLANAENRLLNDVDPSRLHNKLTDVATGLAGLSVTGGSYLSGYDTFAFSNNYSLVTLNRIILTYMYTGNGIFQTAIQLPIQDALSKGVDIECDQLDANDLEELWTYWDEQGIWNDILNAWTWVRLFGGGALLVNSNQEPDSKLVYRGLERSPLDFYDVDRWQLDTNAIIYNEWNAYGSRPGNDVLYFNGVPVHESRVIRGVGKRAPWYVRRQLRGWGMSEGEKMLRELNLFLKTQDATFELIDEAKVDVYHIDGLAAKLATRGGTTAITDRVQAANEIKNYVNALVLDAKESYEQKNMSFTGLAEVMVQNKAQVAAALRIPENKLFGQSATGFASGQDSMENYNAMVESDIRAPMRPMIRKMLKITMAHKFGFIPKFSFSYPSLRELTPEVEQTVKNGEQGRILELYDRGLMDAQESMAEIRKAGIIDI